VPWRTIPDGGLQQIHRTLTHAMARAQRYIYLEDQYLEESVGGDTAYELYPHLRDAAARGVKVVLVGSGVRDPEDIEISLRPINRTLNKDLRDKLVAPLPPALRSNVVVYRVERTTVHAKLTLIDDVFANVGSANMFSRSMMGTDSEVAVALDTDTDAARELRIALWAEHLRTPLTGRLRAALGDLNLALGMWRDEWLPTGAPRETWQRPGVPAGYAPAERALALVGPD
jgi:phosphatidylserine/phosphatidylglycerophosphate/cardiolipin synthase-like enzyme